MTVDTLSYVKRLEAAGVPRAQAEAHAEALRDEVAPQLVTNADLGSAVDRLETGIEAAERRLETRIDAVEQRLETRIGAVEQRLDAKIDTKIDAAEQRLNAKITIESNRLDAKIEAMMWKHTVAIILAVVAVGGLLMRFSR